MKKVLSVIIIGLLCLSTFSIFAPHVKAQTDPLFTSAYGGDPGRDEIMFTSDDLDYVPVIDSVESMGIAVLTVDCQPSTTGDYANDAHKNFEYISQKTGGKHFYYTSPEWNVALATEISSRIGSGKGDVVLTFDLTGSMGWVTGDLKVRTKGIIEALPSTLNIVFGIGTHVDYPHYYNSYGYSDLYGQSPDYAWKMNLDITTDRNAAKNAIDSMTNYWGADGPQDYVRVLYETQFFSWRSDSKKIVVMFGDAPAHSAPSGLTLGAITQKQLLIDSLKLLHAESDKAMEKQVEYFSKILATFRVETYEPEWWTMAKLGADVIADIVAPTDIPSWVPKKYVKALKVAETAYKVVSWGDRAKTLIELVDTFMEDPYLSPTLGIDELTYRYKSKIILNWLYPQFESIMDTTLADTIGYLGALPDSDPAYQDMISEVSRIESWMLRIQSGESTVNYVDFSSPNLASTAKVGGLMDLYYPQFTELLDAYKTGKKVEDVSSAVIIGGLAVKAIGAFLVLAAGTGAAIMTAAETYIGYGMGAAGVVETVSSVYEEIPKRDAVSLVISRIFPALVSDEVSIMSVYEAVFNLVEKWSQRGAYPAENYGFELSQETFVVTPWWSYDSIPTAPIFYQLDVKGIAFVRSKYSSQAKARFALEVTDFLGKYCYTVGGSIACVNPSECVTVDFSLHMADLLSFGETEKTYKVVGFMSFGTSIYVLPSKIFRVVRDSKDAVCSMYTSTTSSTITSGGTLSFPIDIPEGSSYFAISLDFPGSDLDLHLYDSSGKHVGIDYLTGIIQTQMPGSSYSGQTVNPEWILVEGDIGGQTLTAMVVGVDVDKTESFSLSYIIEGDAIKIAPPSSTIFPGQTALYNVTLQNFGDTQTTYDLMLLGLDPLWYEFSPSSLTIDPSQFATASLRVTPPLTASAGNYTFEVSASGAFGKVSALLALEKPLDTLPPTTALAIGEPKYVDPLDNIYVTSAASFTLTAEDNPGGTGVASTLYRIYNSTYDTDWLEYSAPFYLTGLTDGEYSIDYNSTDNAGNVEPTNTAMVILDNTPPTTTLTIGEPKYVSDKTYVTSDTPFTLEATDTGSGVFSIAYRIYNDAYDSGWQTYIAPFKLTSLADGTYTIEYNSTDNVKNVETSHTATFTLFLWNYIYQDTHGRGTTLKINLAHKFFQFITPDKDYGIRKATYMKQCGRAIIISHCDKELRLITVSVDTKIDFCYAIAWDLQTRKCYLLIDKAGIE